MDKASTIRGLERGLQVLIALQATPASSLHELHVATRLSKPSLLRILATLERYGAVRRRVGDGRWRAGVALPRMLRKHGRHESVTEAAGPILDELCRRIAWPSELAVPAGDYMEIVETTRVHSPFVMDHARIGYRINWLLTAMGRAYLAFCSEDERAAVVNKLRKTRSHESQLAREPDRLRAILETVRTRGYATRDPSFVGGYVGRPDYSDGLAAIAVPLRDGNHVHGSINILWIQRAFTIQHMVDQHLAQLQKAARDIVTAISAASA